MFATTVSLDPSMMTGNLEIEIETDKEKQQAYG